MLVTAPIPLHKVGLSKVGASIRRVAFIRGERPIQYNAMQCNAMQCNAMQCNTTQ